MVHIPRRATPPALPLLRGHRVGRTCQTAAGQAGFHPEARILDLVSLDHWSAQLIRGCVTVQHVQSVDLEAILPEDTGGHGPRKQAFGLAPVGDHHLMIFQQEVIIPYRPDTACNPGAASGDQGKMLCLDQAITHRDPVLLRDEQWLLVAKSARFDPDGPQSRVKDHVISGDRG